MKKVSTVIPVFNRAGLLRQCVSSALACTYPDHEIVIVDNCSVDGTWDVMQELAQKHSCIRIFQNSENIGPVKNWFRGVKEAHGFFCNILFSDDLIHKNFINKTVPLLQEDTAFVMTGYDVRSESSVKYIWRPENCGIINRDDYLSPALLINPKNIPTISPGNFLFRRSDLLEAIIPSIPNQFGLDTSLSGAGPDQLIMLLIAWRYKYVRVADDVLASFRHHEGSLSVGLGQSLMFPREFTKWFFIDNYARSLRSLFLSKLCLMSLRHKHLLRLYSTLLNGSEVSPRLFEIMKIATHRIFRRNIQIDLANSDE